MRRTRVLTAYSRMRNTRLSRHEETGARVSVLDCRSFTRALGRSRTRVMVRRRIGHSALALPGSGRQTAVPSASPAVVGEVFAGSAFLEPCFDTAVRARVPDRGRPLSCYKVEDGDALSGVKWSGCLEHARRSRLVPPLAIASNVGATSTFSVEPAGNKISRLGEGRWRVLTRRK